ncbi:MAG: bifunctional homocysteine S-methyltransferase/methylenetetrahydrofolate reductase [Planctomycetota bacterium]|jgi:homocysteine S-methyltransferase
MADFALRVPRASPGTESFADLVARGGVALFDGAMGTMLYSRGVFIHRAFEELNLTRPALVREVHADYLQAGADVIETNTYAANRFKLSAHGLAEQVEQINRRGVEIAREAAAGRAWVGGSLGPLGVRIEPFGPIGRDEAREVFRQQARALADAGVDLFVVETFVHLPEIEEALRAVREVSALPVVAQVSIGRDGVTREGVAAGEAAARMAAAGADVAGVNCSEALAVLDALEGMRAAVDLPLSGQPNAGQPRTVEGRNIYLASPEYVVAWARRALRAGAHFVGGCCGTTPDHIRALRQVVGETVPETPAAEVARPAHVAAAARPVARIEKSALARGLAGGRFVTGVEIPPPTGWRGEHVVAVARELAAAGVDFLALPERAPHVARMPPFALARLCAAVESLETLTHYSCRARWLPRIQSDLLGACALGVTNLLVVTGEPVSAAGDAGPDLDVDSIGAVNLVTRLNHGEDIGGNPIGAPTRFHVGVRLDPTAPDRARELSRFHWKVDAGAEFAVTPPLFDPAALEAMLADARDDAVPVIGTIWPLASAREAEFFEHAMTDVPVPATLVRRMQEAEERGGEREEGLAIARELAAAIRPLVQGLQVVAPDGRAATALAVLR